MNKRTFALFTAALLTSAQAFSLAYANDATVLEGEGKIFNQDHVTVVRKTFSPESPMPRHNHLGAQIVLTVIDGDATFTINDDEQHHLQNGDMFTFSGDNDISGEFARETLITVTLIESDGHTH